MSSEGKLYNIIKKSVNRILKEADFKRIDNLNDYISQNGLQGKMASKFQRVNAQQGSDYIRQYLKQHPELSREEIRNILQNGAPLSTIASDGTQETNNLVTRNHTILNNVGNAENRWSVERGTFNRKYQPSDEGEGIFKPAGKPMKAYPVNEPISFTAPWGEEMNIDKGGQILQDPDNPNDIYGISGKDFENTYKFQENKKYKNKLIEKNMAKKVVKLTESQLHDIITESVKRILKESDDFIGHGYKTTSNWGGNEIQISDSGDAARLKLPSGDVTDWLEIEFDEDGVAYVTTPDGEVERLDEYMRFY